MIRLSRGSGSRAKLLIVALVLWLTSCSYPGPFPWRHGDATREPTQARTLPTSSLAPSPTTGSSDVAKLSPQEQQLVNMACADLAKRLGVAAEQVALLSISPEQWADASLGCPESGKMYAQVITSGYQIILGYGGKTYDYRSNGTSVRLCQKVGST